MTVKVRPFWIIINAPERVFIKDLDDVQLLLPCTPRCSIHMSTLTANIIYNAYIILKMS